MSNRDEMTTTCTSSHGIDAATHEMKRCNRSDVDGGFTKALLTEVRRLRVERERLNEDIMDAEYNRSFPSLYLELNFYPFYARTCISSARVVRRLDDGTGLIHVKDYSHDRQ